MRLQRAKDPGGKVWLDKSWHGSPKAVEAGGRGSEHRVEPVSLGRGDRRQEHEWLRRQ